MNNKIPLFPDNTDTILPVKFIALFTNQYDTLNDIDAFIDAFTREFCEDTGIRCSRLLRPEDPEDVEEVTVQTCK